MIGGSAINIGVNMFLRDQFSGPSRRVGASSKALKQNLQQLNQQVQKLQHIRNMNAGLAAAGVMGIRTMGKWVGTGAKFQYTMAGVGAVTNSTSAEIAALSTQARELGKGTMFMAKDVASAMRYMGMAGMDAKEIAQNIEAAVYLAGATQSQLEGKGGSGDIMTNIMRAFSIDSSRSMHVADALAKATLSANTNLMDLGDALKYSASTAMDLGLDLENTTAMVMSLGDAGIQGSMAGTALENMLRYLSRTMSEFGTKKQKASLAAIGLSPEDLMDARGNLLPISQVLGSIRESMAKMGAGNIKTQNLLQNIFGVRGKRAASLAIREWGNYKDNLNEIINASGTAKTTTGKMMDTIEGGIMRVKSAAEDFKTQFTDNLKPVVMSLLTVAEYILKAVTAVMSMKAIGPILTFLISRWVVMKTVSLAYRAVTAGLKAIFLQNKMSFLTYSNATTRGYNSMTSAALRYAAASRMGGGIMGGALGKNAAGRFINTRTGRFVSSAVASRYTRRFGGAGRGMGGMVGGLLGGKIGGSLLKKGALKGLLGMGGKSLAKGAAIKGGAALLGRGAAALLGGPVGIAITIASFLPMLIGMFRKNNDATDKNNRELGGLQTSLGRNSDAVNALTGEIVTLTNSQMSFAEKDIQKYMTASATSTRGMELEAFRREMINNANRASADPDFLLQEFARKKLEEKYGEASSNIKLTITNGDVDLTNTTLDNNVTLQ